ncbi:MAG: replicative DNA helicase [Gammaproteobacteria bacterium]|nr:replicative DNA helicase [Gammaproteobacteria bacterium]
MLNNRLYFDLADRLSETDFYRADHQLIYKAIGELIGNNKPCDFVTLSEHLRHQGKLDDAGGVAYLGSLAVDTYSVANVLSYADIVRERAVLRGLIQVGNDIGEMGYRPDGRTPSELIDSAEQKVFAIREKGARGSSVYHPISKLLDDVERRIEMLRMNPGGLAGLSTGFSEFDRMTSGLHPGDLAIVAGRPGMGKCLAHDSEIVLADGSVATVEAIYRQRRAALLTLGSDWRLGLTQPSDFVDDGKKPVFRVRTRLGREIETTLAHPFLTVSGWRRLEELAAGTAIAGPRRIPIFGEESVPPFEARLLGYLLGDGTLTHINPAFTNSDERLREDFIEAVSDFGGLRTRLDDNGGARTPTLYVALDRASDAARRECFAAWLRDRLAVRGSGRHLAHRLGVRPSAISNWLGGRSLPSPDVLGILEREYGFELSDLQLRAGACNPLRAWLMELGLWGCGAHDKHIPQAVFRWRRELLAAMLNRLFATDGWATVLASGQCQLGYATVSRKLAGQVQHLLLRFGIIAALKARRVRYGAEKRDAWQLDITQADSIRAFIGEIGIFGKEEVLKRVARTLDGKRAHSNRDVVPAEVWARLEVLKGRESWLSLGRRAGLGGASNLHVGKRGLSRDRLAALARALGDAELQAMASGDVYWDEIVDITPMGEKQVYDLTVGGTHNFVANDVCVHNTSFSMNIAEHAAIIDGKGVAVFSMEMSGEQLAMRVLSSFGRIELKRLRTGDLGDHDYDKLVSASTLVRNAPLFIDETGALSPLELRARARRLKSQHDIQLIVVDYIQLMQVPGNKENRTSEISEISRGLKALGKEIGVPVIALSQLNRGVEQRDNKRPRMSDLRESGGIEQDADLIVFIYRDEVYNEASPDKGTAEIIISKQRNGPTGTFRTAFVKECTRFDNLADASFETE